MGWIVTLFLIIAAQGKDITDKQAQIMVLQAQRERYIQEIDKLESSIGPLKKLGVVEDTAQLNSFGAIRDWVSYLKHLENTRREE
jgi:competence protein ComGC